MPKGADLPVLTPRQLDAIAMEMMRPHKTLDWRTPAEALIENCKKQGMEIDPTVAPVA
ncbi:hypothetical protein B0G62_105223 [Paraburkholderia eburnea]|uniref:Uncharacterized protein n=1 Tax=Paraburkholderia eburnea TaxID=1189126 RepID=A0A2S4MC90_9BURK|nr:hypothetical protein B0G62_105223 [Paraburkholderia eburnea]PRZ23146.1 hypothetical protein BX588_105223 [Paraburkholderia eburnea]